MKKLGVINLYISKKYQKYFEELKVCAEANDSKLSTEIMKAVKESRENLENNINLTDEDVWSKVLKNSTKEELLELSTFICEMNTKIIRKCQQ